MAIQIVHRFQAVGTGDVEKKLESTAKAAEKTAKATAGVGTNWAQVATAVSTSYLAVTQVMGQMSRAFSAFTRGAIEGEMASHKLGKSLKAFGGYSQEAVDSMNAFADSMELVTGVQAEAILEGISLAKSFGVSNEQAKTLAHTAMGASKALGVDFNTAMQQLVQTFDGSSGRLGRLIPELDQLTATQLKSGAAVDVLRAKFSSFVNDGIQPTGLALTRVQNAFNQTLDSAAESFLKGFDANDAANVVQQNFDILKGTIARNQNAFELLGKVASDFFKTLGDPALWNPIINRFGAFMTAMDQSGFGKKLKDIFMSVIPAIENFSLRIMKAGIGLKSLWDIIRLGATGQFSELKAQLKETAAIIDQIDMEIIQNVSAQDQAWIGAGQSLMNFVELYGSEYQKLAAMTPPVPDASGATPKAKGPAAPKTEAFGSIIARQSGAEMEAQLAAARKIGEQIAKLRDGESSGLVAARRQALAEVDQAEAESRAKNQKLDQQYAALRVEIMRRAYADAKKAVEDFGKSASEIELSGIRKAEKELRELSALGVNPAEIESAIKKAEQIRIREVTKSITELKAQNQGAFATLRHQYEQDLQAYKEMLKSKGIEDEKYFEEYKAEREKQLKAAERMAARQTTGNANTDQNISDALTIINSAGSINSMVGSIGKFFGPWGNIVAGIFQFLNQAPAQFQEFLRGMHRAAIEALPNLLSNVSTLVRESVRGLPEILGQAMEMSYSLIPTLIMDAVAGFMEALPGVMDQFFSVSFWTKIGDRAFQSIQASFKNFWSLLFSGKSLKPAIESATDAQKQAAMKPAEFGKNDQNAADAIFRVRQLEESNAAQTFEQRVDVAAEKSGQSLFDALREAWQWVIDNVFLKVHGWLTAPFQWVKEKVFDPFHNAHKALYEATIKPIYDNAVAGFRFVYETLFAPVARAFISAWQTIVQPIGQMFIDGFRGVWENYGRPVANLLGEKMGQVWNLVWNTTQTLWDGFQRSWDGLQSAFKRVLNPFINLMNALQLPAISIPKVEWKGITVIPQMQIMGAMDLIPGTIPMLAGGGFVPNAPNIALASMLATLGGAGYAAGGSVGSDTVPALLTPGELVLSVPQVNALQSGALMLGAGAQGMRGGGGDTYNITVNVSPASLDKKYVETTLVPTMIETLKRKSREGQSLMTSRGVY